MRKLLVCITIIPMFFLCCEGEKKVETQPKQKAEDFMQFPITSAEEVLTKTNIEFDKEITSDGNGSLLVNAKDSMIVRLFEIEDPDIENARIVYQAKLRTEDLNGAAYLEILCNFKGIGEFFGRGLDNYLKGTTDWSSVQTYFFLKEGENPDLIKLNLIITGPGRVWIDDIRLVKGPLKM